MPHVWQRDGFTISTNQTQLNLPLIHQFLTNSYWAGGISLERVERAIKNSLAFGLYQGTQQIGFARIVTDYATFAYLDDVFILEPFRGQGLSRWLVATIQSHPDLQGLRRWLLATKDAHGVYQKLDFTPLRWPERFMEVLVPDAYTKLS